MKEIPAEEWTMIEEERCACVKFNLIGASSRASMWSRQTNIHKIVCLYNVMKAAVDPKDQKYIFDSFTVWQPLCGVYPLMQKIHELIVLILIMIAKLYVGRIDVLNFETELCRKAIKKLYSVIVCA